MPWKRAEHLHKIAYSHKSDYCISYAEYRSAQDILPQFENLLILKAFTKNFALAGARVGYCLTENHALLRKMSQSCQPWNVSLPAQAAGVAALQEWSWVSRARDLTRRERAYLSQELPALGFAMGIERLMLVLKAKGVALPSKGGCELYLAAIGQKASLKATEICSVLRADGFSAQTDICARGLKAQMKYANKLGARFSAVLGDDEIGSGRARVKNMATGEETEILLDNISEELLKLINNQALSELTDSLSE